MEPPQALPSSEDEASELTQAHDKDRVGDPAEEEDCDGKETAESRKGTRAKKGPELMRKFWSKADELRLLRRLLEFSARKKENPVYDWDDRYKFITSDLETFYTKDQVIHKVSYMKKKYRDRVKLGKKKRAMSPDELAVYRLSRKLWRDEVKGESSARNHGDGKAERGDRTALAALKAELLVFDRMPKGMGSGFLSEMKRFSVVGVDEEFLRAGLGLIKRKERIELEEKWRKLQMAELGALAERAELIHLAAEAILEAYAAPKAELLVFDRMPNGMGSRFLSRFSALGVDEEFLRAGLGLIERKEKAELKEKWRKLQMAELTALAKRAELMHFAAEAILEAYELRSAELRAQVEISFLPMMT